MSISQSQFDEMFASSRRQPNDSDFQIDAAAILAFGGNAFITPRHRNVKVHWGGEYSTPIDPITVEILDGFRQANQFAWRKELAALKHRMRAEIEELRQTVQVLESYLPALAASAPYFDVVEALGRIKQVTAELFGHDNFEVRESHDHEIENDRYFTFRVKDSGTRQQVSERYNQWHSRLSEVPCNLRHLFRLSIDLRK